MSQGFKSSGDSASKDVRSLGLSLAYAARWPRERLGAGSILCSVKRRPSGSLLGGSGGRLFRSRLSYFTPFAMAFSTRLLGIDLANGLRHASGPLAGCAASPRRIGHLECLNSAC